MKKTRGTVYVHSTTKWGLGKCCGVYADEPGPAVPVEKRYNTYLTPSHNCQLECSSCGCWGETWISGDGDAVDHFAIGQVISSPVPNCQKDAFFQLRKKASTELAHRLGYELVFLPFGDGESRGQVDDFAFHWLDLRYGAPTWKAR